MCIISSCQPLPLQDVTPEVVKREADLNLLKLFSELSGHTSQKEELTQQDGEATGLDEILVRYYI